MASIGCEILPLDPTTQNGPPGTTLTYRFQITPITGGCAGTVSGTVLIGADTTAGSSASPTSWSGSPNQIITISVALANSPGGNAAYTINCPAGQCNGGNSSIAINARINDSYTLAATTPTSVTARTGQTVPIGVRYLVSGQPSTLDTTWTVDSPSGNVGAATVTPDVNGDATTYFFSYTPGTYLVTAAGQCPISAAAPNCPPAPIVFQIVVEQPVLSIVTPSGGNATIPVNTPITLQINYSGPTLPVADGTSIQWNVLSEPSLGAGVFTPQSFGPPSSSYTSTTGGFSQVDFQGSAPGIYTLKACYAPDGCSSTDFVTFNITVVILSADLSITNADTPDPVGPGGALSYSIVVANSGPTVATNMTLDDALPAQVVFQSLVSPAGWSCTTPAINSNGSISCTAASLASGASANFTLGVKVGVSVAGGTSIQNTAITSSQTPDPNLGNESDSAFTTVTTSPLMTVTKVLTGTVDNDSSGGVTPGDRLDYTVTAINSGNLPLSNVLVSDDHFAGTQSCTSVPLNGTCVLTGSYFVAPADASAGSVTNVGSATSTEVPGPVIASVNTPVLATAAPSMSVVKVLTGSVDNDSSGNVTPGDRLDYSVTASNNGNVPLGNVVVSDDHFAATNSCASVPVNGTCVLTGSYVVLASDASAGSVTNIGSASSTQVSGPITSSVNTPISPSPAPAMTVIKLLTGSVDNDASGSVTTGDRLDYSVTARNTGNIPLGNVLVSDNHFAATTSCASLAVNATCVLTGSYTVAASDATAGSINNIGSASSTQVPGPVTSSVLTAVNPPVNRTLSIVSGNNQFGAPGTPLALPLVVRALNNSAAALGVVTNWTVTIGNATLGSASVTTNAAGEASNSLTLGPSAGPVTVRVSRADAPTVIAVFSENAAELDGLAGLNDNQRAIADVLDTICPKLPASSSDPKVNDLRQRCQDLFRAIGSDPAGVADALDQLFTDVALMQSELGFLAAQAQFDNIKARIAALRSGTRGTSFGGLALSTGTGRIPLGSMLQNMLDGDGPKDKEVGADFSRWGFFASGTMGRGNADAGSLSPSYDFDINGLTVGADYRKSDKLIFGGSLGYSKQDSDLTGGLGKLEASGWSASAYGTFFQADSWYSDAVLSIGRNTYMTERRLHYSFTLPGGATTTIDQQGKGDSSGDSLSFAASFGRDFNKGGWGFGPYFRAMYTKLSFDQVDEKLNGSVPGSGLALSIDGREVTSLSSTLGGKLTYAHSASWGVMIPHVQLEWQHEFKTDPAAVEAHFLYDPTATPFTIHGDEVDSDFFRFGVGMSFVMTHGRSGFFYYERLISRERFSQNSLAFGLRLEF